MKYVNGKTPLEKWSPIDGIFNGEQLSKINLRHHAEPLEYILQHKCFVEDKASKIKTYIEILRAKASLKKVSGDDGSHESSSGSDTD